MHQTKINEKFILPDLEKIHVWISCQRDEFRKPSMSTCFGSGLCSSALHFNTSTTINVISKAKKKCWMIPWMCTAYYLAIYWPKTLYAHMKKNALAFMHRSSIFAEAVWYAYTKVHDKLGVCNFYWCCDQ